MKRRSTILLLYISILNSTFLSGQGQSILLQDIFGRSLNERGITLVDWEGYLANPAIHLFLTPPEELKYPIRIVLQAPETRAYFDKSSDSSTNGASQVGIFGPRKTIHLFSPRRVGFYMSIWPDHEVSDRRFPLQITITQADGTALYSEVKIHVIDQDNQLGSPNFEIHVDFSKDSTGYFSEFNRRTPIRRAAEDWSYFFDGSGLDSIAKGEEKTLVTGPNGWENPRELVNESQYRGFWLYVLGNYQSTGGWAAQSKEGFQHSAGKPIPLRRSGAIGIETKPAGISDGYLLSFGDWEWWRFIYQVGLPVELYSLAQHEIGHSLFVESQYPLFKQWEHWPGYIQDSEVLGYQKAYPEIGPGGHFVGTVDRLSRLPAYGSGESFMPNRRWITTKLDLLVAQAVGHKLRPTSAFLPLTIKAKSEHSARLGKPFSYTPEATGGVPFYYWSIKSGSLPEGLSLDSFTGAINGTPTKKGVYTFSLTVQEYDELSIPVSEKIQLAVDIH